MRRSLGLAASALAVGALILAAPARADDAVAYAARHMIQPEDIPGALGTFGHGTQFSGQHPGPVSLACSVKEGDVRIPVPPDLFSVLFVPKGQQGTEVSELVYQYADAASARRSWDRLQRRITTCSFTDTDGGANPDGSTWSASTVSTVGVVPRVTVNGVESVFVNQDSTSEASAPPTSVYSSDTYTVFSLVDDVIIATGLGTDAAGALTTRQRAKIDRLAHRAVGSWTG